MQEYKTIANKLLLSLLDEQSPEKKLIHICRLLTEYIPAYMVVLSVADKTKSEAVRYYAYKDNEISMRFYKNKTMIDFNETLKDAPKVRFALTRAKDRAFYDVNFKEFFPETNDILSVVINEYPDLFFSYTFQAKEAHTFTDEHKNILLEFYDVLKKITEDFLISTKEFEQVLKKNVLNENSYELLLKSKTLKNELNLINKIAKTDLPVLILGETGVGKELFADAVHFLSDRKNTPLIKVNCAAITESLFDSEFFGHEKGSFTSAANQHIGHFERANNGAIFLDEIGELSLTMQAKLLRVLENSDFMRVGGTRNIPINIRFIFATNKNLEDLVKLGKFREDLWYRLNVLPIFVPPLRQRREDIKNFAEYFYNRAILKYNITKPPKLSQQVINQLYQYEWQGNVRELLHTIERSLICHSNKAELYLDFGNVYKQSYNKTKSFDEMSIEYIQDALIKCQGRINGPKGTAKLLGVNPSTLRSRMIKLGIL